MAANNGQKSQVSPRFSASNSQMKKSTSATAANPMSTRISHTDRGVGAGGRMGSAGHSSGGQSRNSSSCQTVPGIISGFPATRLGWGGACENTTAASD